MRLVVTDYRRTAHVRVGEALCDARIKEGQNDAAHLQDRSAGRSPQTNRIHEFGWVLSRYKRSTDLPTLTWVLSACRTVWELRHIGGSDMARERRLVRGLVRRGGLWSLDTEGRPAYTAAVHESAGLLPQREGGMGALGLPEYSSGLSIFVGEPSSASLRVCEKSVHSCRQTNLH